MVKLLEEANTDTLRFGKSATSSCYSICEALKMPRKPATSPGCE